MIQLTARERQAIDLKDGGLKVDAIAVALGIARGTVKVHLKNARLKIKLAAQQEVSAPALSAPSPHAPKEESPV